VKLAILFLTALASWLKKDVVKHGAIDMDPEEVTSAGRSEVTMAE